MPREGSIWRKWDLHLHSPSTVLANEFAGGDSDAGWEQYTAKLESLGEYGVLGITDYFGIDGYIKLTAIKRSGRLENVAAIFPNIELRITPVTDTNTPINFHLLCNPEIVDDLDSFFFSKLTFAFQGETYDCTRNRLVALGRAFSSDPGLDEKAAHRAGVTQFKTDLEQIRACLDASTTFRRNVLLAVANGSNDGNSGIQDSGLAATRTEIYRTADIIFSGRPGDRKYFLGELTDTPGDIKRKFGAIKPCVHGCDAHDLDRIGNPDLQRHTWIKADPTFEGLRQILFEPDTRVAIGPNAPNVPLHRARSVRMNFPLTSDLDWEGTKTAFCLAGDQELAFASGLTCFIGGRGAGKSTIINVLQERLRPGENSFFQEKRVRAEGATVAFESAVNVEFGGDNRGIEFVSQNQIEDFALDPSRLTSAIALRLLSIDSTGALRAAESACSATVDNSDLRLSLISVRERIKAEIADLEGQLNSANRLLSTFADQEYTGLTSALQELATELEQLSASRAKFASFVSSIREVLSNSEIPPAVDDENEYDVRLRQLSEAINRLLVNNVSGVDLNTAGTREVELETSISERREVLEEYLRARGLSPENVNDLATAGEKASKLNQEIEERRFALSKAVEEYEAAIPPVGSRLRFESEVNRLVGEVNTRFSEGHSETRRIELRYRFNIESAEDSAIEWLKTDIESNFPASRVRADHIKTLLESAGSILEHPVADTIQAVRRETTKVAGTVDAYFGTVANVEKWEIVREKEKADVLRFRCLDVLYDSRPLQQSSFGQRCSAVLVVLLSLGNTPIVIDEPEAHLDSALIAGFLVDLVKRVKRDRQIIFATHNANFVVNGDAELIHVLTMDGGGQTTLRSTTIEDLSDRAAILALEGGEQAFLQREGRYGINR